MNLVFYNFSDPFFTAEISLDSFGIASPKIQGEELEKRINGRGFVVNRCISGNKPLFPPNIMYPDELYVKVKSVGEFL